MSAPHGFVFRSDPRTYRARRVFDIVTACAGLIVASPILALTALAVLLEDGAPVFYKQRRVGRFERTFTLYKIRSMRKNDCSDAISPRSSTDSRITRVGRFIRKISIDELPQLVNVIRGDMSLVGPRPEMPFVTLGYERWQHLRHLTTPGLTCHWQIEYRKTIPLDHPDATSLDLHYIRNASPTLDGLLILRTLKALLIAKGAF